MFLGKIVPYFVVAAVDLAIVLAVGMRCSACRSAGRAVFALGALLFLFVTLGIGVLISSVSQNQGQAIQLAMMTLLPQVLLSGLIFPLSSIAAGVRWIAYLLPLTYFNEISRGVMLRAEPIGPLWQPLRCSWPCSALVVIDAWPRCGSAASWRRPGGERPGRHRRGRRGVGAAGPGPGVGDRLRQSAPGGAAADRAVRVRPAVALDHVPAGPPGQVTAVVGGDGAGKTTLLRCLAGALAPDAGTVRGPPRQGSATCPPASGIVPGPDRGREPAPSGRPSTAAGAAGARASGEYLDRTGLAAARDRLAGQLSGGMRQKLGVIAAMLHRPELLVLDEPTTGRRPGEPGRPVVADRPGGGRGRRGGARHDLPGRGRARRRVLVLDAGRPRRGDAG